MSTIDPFKGSPGPALTSTSTGSTRAAKNVTPPKVDKADTLDSSDKVELSAAARVSGSEAPFRPEEVARIKNAIAKGEFKVDSEKVAAGIIDSARSLIRDNA